MPKLTGIAKSKFLARLNKGRVAKGLKAIKAKGSKILPKTRLKRRKASKSQSKPRKANKPTKRSNSVVFKKGKGSRRSRVGISLKKLVMGGVTGIALELLLTRLGATSLAVDAGYVGASMVGSKSGVIGNAVFRQGVARFGGQLGFLGSGNGNGQAQNTGFSGFA